jgi:exosortase
LVPHLEAATEEVSLIASVRTSLIWLVIGLLATAWSYGSTLIAMSERWLADPQYSHGWLIPLFSLYLLIHRRKQLSAETFQPRLWGLGIVAVALAIRGFSVAIYQPWLDAASMLICLTGLFATVGGVTGLRWAWPSIIMLGFMIPLPFRVQFLLGSTLQSMATKASTYLLQTFGVPAIAEGNVILLSQTKIGVVEACNGLSMLLTFFALAAGFVLLLERKWWYGVILIAAAAPIAVAANVIRITATGILYEAAQDRWARIVFHDLAGWLMMPLGVIMLAAVVWYLDRIQSKRKT